MFCVLQAVLDASADLQRPLTAEAIQRVVHLTERHHGWPSWHRLRLMELVGEDLRALVLIDSGKIVVSPGTPCLLFYKEPSGSAHCVYTYPPFPEAKKVHYVMVLMPKGRLDGE